MPLNGWINARRIAVVHKPVTEAQSPERWSAELVCGGLVEVFGLSGLGDAISRANVVKQEVAVRMNECIANESWDLVRTIVDSRSWPKGLVAWNVAKRAADLIKEFLPCSGVGAGG
jgi:hypothetical protein